MFMANKRLISGILNIKEKKKNTTKLNGTDKK